MMDEEMRLRAQTLKACLPEGLRKPNLRRWEASQYLLFVYGLVIAPATLAKRASIGGGPRFLKGGKESGSGRTPYYPVEELDRWATQNLGRLVASTSEVSD